MAAGCRVQTHAEITATVRPKQNCARDQITKHVRAENRLLRLRTTKAEAGV